MNPPTSHMRTLDPAAGVGHRMASYTTPRDMERDGFHQSIIRVKPKSISSLTSMQSGGVDKLYVYMLSSSFVKFTSQMMMTASIPSHSGQYRICVHVVIFQYNPLAHD